MTVDDAAIPLNFAGGFPSDLVVDGSGRLVTMPDALIPTSVVVYDVKSAPATPLFQVPISVSDLIDHDGMSPARAPVAFGTGLFGAYTGDVEVISDRWLLVTVGAGNSTSTDSNGVTLRLANLLVIDLFSGNVVQTVNLAWTLAASGQTSGGAAYSAVPQSLPSMIAVIPATDGTPTARVYVAMSNGGGSTGGLQDFFHGTVQSWKADFTKPQPLSPDTAGKAPADVTRTYVSAYYNPVGFTKYGNQHGKAFLMLTNAGASLFNANFVLEPTTDAVLEFLDVYADAWRDDWTVNLGPVLPSVSALALGKDAGGALFGAFASQTFAAAYFVDLSGLDQDPVDPQGLRLVRTVALEAGGPTTLGSGFQPGLVLSPDAKRVYVSSFNAATLHVLSVPDDIELGVIGVDEPPFDGIGALASSPGALAAPTGATADLFFIVNGTYDSNFLPLGSSFVGTATAD